MVAIKDVRMPNHCSECGFCLEEIDEYGQINSNDHYCYFHRFERLGLERFDKRRGDCPLVEVNDGSN